MDDELSVLFDTRHLNILRSLNKRVETRQMFHADSSNSRETVLSDVLIDIEVVDVLNTLFEHLVSLKGELDIDVDVRGHPSDFEDCEHVYLLSDDMNTDQASNATTPYQRRQKRIHEVCGNVDEYGTMSTTYAMANNTSILLKKSFSFASSFTSKVSNHKGDAPRGDLQQQRQQQQIYDKGKKYDIPLQLQHDLALLWRTLSVLRFSGSPHLMQSFFAQFLHSLRRSPPLSLSTTWLGSSLVGASANNNDDNDNYDTVKSKNDSTIDPSNNSTRPNHLNASATIDASSNGSNGNRVNLEEMVDQNVTHDGRAQLAQTSPSRRNISVNNTEDGGSNEIVPSTNIENASSRGALANRDELAAIRMLSGVERLEDGADAVFGPIINHGASSEAKASSIASKSTTSDDNRVLDLPELLYLSNGTEDAGDPSMLNIRHDPVGVVQKLLDSAESCAFASVPEERGPLLSVCLWLCIKSGRISLICQVASLLLSERGKEFRDMNIDPLQDILEYIKTSLSLESMSEIDSKKKEQIYGLLVDNKNYTSRIDQNILSVIHSKEVKGGILLSFGKADHGKLGHGDTQLHRLVPTVVESLQGKHITKIASMSTCVLATDEKGVVYVWGSGASVSHHSRPGMYPIHLEALPLNQPVRDISCGLGHALFLLDSGAVYSWGNGGNGRLGLGDMHDRAEAAIVTGLPPMGVQAVQCGASHSMALLVNGDVYCWGKNSQGQCGIDHTDENVLSPTLVKAFNVQNTKVVQIAAGWEHSAGLSQEGRLYMWGCGYKDSRRGVIPPVLGLGDSEGRTVPTLITSIESIRISKVTCGWDHCLALDANGKLLSWGSGQNGKLGHGTEENFSVPTYVTALENTRLSYISAGCEHSAVIGIDGMVYTWGHGDGGRLGHGDGAQSLVPTPIVGLQMTEQITPFEVHCGDKFTMTIVRPKSASFRSNNKNDTKSKKEEVSTSITMDSDEVIKKLLAGEGNVELSHLVDMLPKRNGDEEKHGSPALTREQIAELLLMLSSTCSLFHLRDGLVKDGNKQTKSDTPYAVECSLPTFGFLLTLLEIVLGSNYETLVGSKSALLSSYNNEGNQGNQLEQSLRESINLEDSMSFDFEESMNFELSMNSVMLQHQQDKDLVRNEHDNSNQNSKSNLTANITAASKRADSGNNNNNDSNNMVFRADYLISRSKLLRYTLSIVRANLHALYNFVGKSGALREARVAVNASNSKEGMVDTKEKVDGPRFLDNSLDCVSDDGDNMSHDSDEFEKALESEDTSNIGNLSSMVDYLTMTPTNHDEHGEKSNKDTIVVGEDGSRMDSVVSPTEKDDSFDRTGKGPNVSMDQENNEHIDASPTINDVDPRLDMSQSMDGILSIDDTLVLEQSQDSLMESKTGNFSKSFPDIDKEEGGSNMMNKTNSHQGIGANTSNVMEEKDNSTLLSSMRTTNGLTSTTTRMREPHEYSLESDDDSDYYSQDAHEEVDQDMEDLDLQKAILSSMEMPSSKEEGGLVIHRFHNCVDEVHVTLPRIKVIIEVLAAKSFAALNISDDALLESDSQVKNTPDLSESQCGELSVIWSELQSSVATSYGTLYTIAEQKALLFQIITKPAQYLHILPGVVEEVLQPTAISCDYFKGISVKELTSLVVFVRDVEVVDKLPFRTFPGVEKVKQQLKKYIYRLIVAIVSRALSYFHGSIDVIDSVKRDVNILLDVLLRAVELEWKHFCISNENSAFDVDVSFSASVLPLVGGAFANTSNLSSISFFLPHARRVLQMYSNVAKGCVNDAPVLVWLSSVVKWTSLFFANVIAFFQNPPSHLKPVDLRGLYISYKVLFDTTLSYEACQSRIIQSVNTEKGGMLHGYELWLHMSHLLSPMGGTEKNSSNATDFDTILLDANTMHVTKPLKDLNMALADQVSHLYMFSSSMLWERLLADKHLKSHTILLSFLRNVFASRGDRLPEVSIMNDSIKHIQKEVDLLMEIVTLLFCIMLKSNGVEEVGANVLEQPVSPKSALKEIENADKSILLSAWTTSFIFTCLMAANLQKSITNVALRESKLKSIIMHCGRLLTKPLQKCPFLVDSATFGKEVSYAMQSTQPDTSESVLYVETLQLLRDLSYQCDLHIDTWFSSPDIDNTQSTTELILGSLESMTQYHDKELQQRQQQEQQSYQLKMSVVLMGVLMGSAEVDTIESFAVWEESCVRNAAASLDLIISVHELLGVRIDTQSYFLSALRLRLIPLKDLYEKHEYHGVLERNTSGTTEQSIVPKRCQLLQATLDHFDDMIVNRFQGPPFAVSGNGEAIGSLMSYMMLQKLITAVVEGFLRRHFRREQLCQYLTAPLKTTILAMTNICDRMVDNISNTSDAIKAPQVHLVQHLSQCIAFLGAHTESRFIRSMSSTLVEGFLFERNRLSNNIGSSSVPMTILDRTIPVSYANCVQMLILLGRGLSSMTVTMANVFDQVHSFIASFRANKASLLCPRVKNLNSTSPSVLSNVFTPDGEYIMGFWMYISDDIVSSSHRTTDTKVDSDRRRIHLISRVQETGDFNLISLFNSNNNTCDCNPSVCLLLENGDASIVMNATVYDYVTSYGAGDVATRSHSSRRINISSGRVPFNKWIHCAIQTSIELVDEKNSQIVEEDEGRRGEGSPRAKIAPREKTSISLYIDGVKVKDESAFGGRSPLYQNVIVGSIPSSLVNTADAHLHLQERGSLLIGDLYWTTTTPGAIESLDEDNDSLRGYALSQPPSKVFELATTIVSSAVQCLLMFASNLVTIARAPGKTVLPSTIVTSLPSILNFTLDIIYVGDQSAQEMAILALRSIIATIPLFETTTDMVMDKASTTDSNGNVDKTPERKATVSSQSPATTMATPPVGSAKSAVQMSKARATLTSVLEQLLFIGESFGKSDPERFGKQSSSTDVDDNSSLFFTSDTSFPSNDSSCACRRVCQKIWKMRQIFDAERNESGFHSIWLKHFNIEKDVLLRDISAAMADSLSRSIIDDSFFLSAHRKVPSSPIKGNADEQLLFPIKSDIKDISDSKQNEHLHLSAIISAGGWPVSPRMHSYIHLKPQSLHISNRHHETKYSGDQVLFPSEVLVLQCSAKHGMSTFGLCSTAESINSDFVLNLDIPEIKVPMFNLDNTVSYARLAAVSEPFRIVPLKIVQPVLASIKVPVCTDVINMLAENIQMTGPIAEDKNKGSNIRGSSTTLVESGDKQNVSLIDGSISKNVPSSQDIIGATDREDKTAGARSTPRESMKPNLLLLMAYLRSLLSQILLIEQLEEVDREDQMNHLSVLMEAELPNIVSLADKDPVEVLVDLLHANKSKDAIFLQLKKLLEVGDIPLLERFCSEWGRCSGTKRRSTTDGNFSIPIGAMGGSSGGNELSTGLSSLIMTPVSGDVQVSENKVRALTHFPSLKLPNIFLKQRSGRWFYECCLLSDGLMQIGWANNQFRCDPICGQGVGDHAHSWAFDGLRMKRWNVSCEPYGKRWRLGDIIGVLLDMDLMEMRFYMNGEDLGSAFTSFTANGIYPAISLNVRQCVRVNFGQYKFMYPPDEIDGKPFKPISEALGVRRVDRVRSRYPSHPASTSTLPAFDLSSPARTDRGGDNVSTTNVNNTTNETPTRVSLVDETITGADRAVSFDTERTLAPVNENGAATGIPRMLNVSEFDSVPNNNDSDDDEDDEEDYSDDDGSAGPDNDEGDEEKNETATDRETWDGVIEQHHNRENDTADGAGENSSNHEENTQISELRRQALIENLISMGFPIDWALRGAEHCDANSSEAHVIAWIIERMEMEQNRLDEYDHDSSRIMDEEENEEAEELNLDYLLQRRSMGGGSSSTNNNHADRGNARLRGTMLLTNSFGSNGKSSGPDGVNFDSKQQNEFLMDHSLRGGPEGGVWKTEFLYSRVLFSSATLHSRDSENLHLLHQLQEQSLTESESGVVINACRFALCIAYARAISMRALRYSMSSTPFCPHKSVKSSGNVFEVSVLYSILLNTASDSLVKLLETSFSTALRSLGQSGKLLPPMKEKYRYSLEPFCSQNTCEVSREIHRLENLLFKSTAALAAYERLDADILETITSFLSTLIYFVRATEEEGTIVETTGETEKDLIDDDNKNDKDDKGGSDAKSNFSSNVRELEGNIIRKSGLLLNAGSVINKSQLSDASSDLIEGMIQDALNTIDTASNDELQGWDWIHNCKEEARFDSKAEEDEMLQRHKASSQLPVIWSFMVLRTILTSDWLYTEDRTGHYLPGFSLKERDPIFTVSSAKTFNELLKCCLCRNMSLKYCVFDLCSLILSRLHFNIRYSRSDTQYDSLIQGAAEYYLSLSKEKRLLQSFGFRMRTEKGPKRLYSPYCRALGTFLLQWQMLRRQLGIFVEAHVHDYIQMDWTSPALYTSAKGVQEEDSLRVVNIASNSVTVEWNLPNFFQAQESNLANDGKTLFYVELYIAVVSNMGLEKPMQVTFVEDIKGEHKIGYLNSDALYHIFIRKRTLSRIPDTVQEDNKGLSSQDGVDAVVDGEFKVAGGTDEQQVDADPNKDEEQKISDVQGEKEEPNELSSITNNNDDKRVEDKLETKGVSSHADSQSLAPQQSSGENKTEIVEVCTYVATLSEPLFMLDTEHANNNLEIGKHSLSLRNLVNKKWSTARASVKLTSGVHRWDVRIDRCVSKNIFIGVVSAQARLDNYVGCDRYGWAFLANKAVWHNKSKMRGYGDLFRTGDTVTVCLDLDAGTLSFSLNGKDLGVAVDGLTGPLYPAFSLYNEDDRVSIVPQGCVDSLMHVQSTLSSSWSAYASASERILDRMDALTRILTHVIDGYDLLHSPDQATDKFNHERNNQTSEISSDPFNIMIEITNRYNAWMRGVGIRSTLSDEGFVCIIQSSDLCDRLCYPYSSSLSERLYPGAILELESVLYVIVGAANHRFWLQKCDTGEVTGFTARALYSAMSISPSISNSKPSSSGTDTGKTSCAFAHDGESEEVIQQLVDEDETMSSKPPMIVPGLGDTIDDSGVDGNRQGGQQQRPDSNMDNDVDNTEEMPSPILPGVVDKPDTVSAAMDNEAVFHPDSDQKKMDDAKPSIRAPKPVIDTAYQYTESEIIPTLITQQGSWSAPEDSALCQWLNKIADLTYSHALNLSVDELKRWLAKGKPKSNDDISNNGNTSNNNVGVHLHLPGKSDKEVLLRVATMTHLNDLLVPLLPLMSPDGCQHIFNNPSNLLARLRHVVLASVTNEFIHHTSSPPKRTAPFYPHLLVEPELGYDDLFVRMQQREQKSNAKDADKIGEVQPLTIYIEPEEVVSHRIHRALCATSREEVLKDQRWLLLMSIQSSYVGQLHACLEKASQGNILVDRHIQSAQDAETSDKFEIILRSFLCQHLLSRDLITPVVMRRVSLQINAIESSLAVELESSDMCADSPLLQVLHANAKKSNDADICVSPWTTLAFFIEEALDQADRVIRMMYSDRQHLKYSLSAAEASIFAQFFQELGVLIGIGLRNGVPVKCDLPVSFVTSLLHTADTKTGKGGSENNEKSDDGTRETEEKVLSLCFARGVTSILPTPIFELITAEAMNNLLNGSPHENCVFHLRREATYAKGVNKNDLHITLFFSVLAEMPPFALKAIRVALFGIDEYNNLHRKMRIIPPTALALLTPDTAEISIIEGTSSISIPRVSLITTMRTKVDELCTKLSLRN